MTGKIKISKLDAARRQIETSIMLYFDNGDPVSIHSLACSAHELLTDKCKLIGLKSDKDKIFETIPTLFQKNIFFKLNKVKNFIKHADRDPEAVIAFHPSISEAWLADCCSMYQRITGEKNKLMNYFLIWFVVSNPHLVVDGKEKEIVQNFVNNKSNRTDFFNEMMSK